MKDENDRLRDGTLPADPFADAEPFDPGAESPGRHGRSGTTTPRAGHRPPTTWADRLTTVDNNWLSHPLPPREYLLVDMRTELGAWPTRGVAVIGAAGGVGKSYATLGLAVAVATATPWLGVFRPGSAGRALVVSAEDPADEIRRRIFDVARSVGVTSIPEGAIDVIDVHDLHMPLLDRDASQTAYAQELVELARKRGPYAVTIVDPLARISGVSIDADNAAACALVTALEEIGTGACGLVLGVHHTSQGARRGAITDATALRGATGLGDSARLVTIMTVEDIDVRDTPQWADLGQIVTMTIAKCNHVRRWDPVLLRRGEHGELLPFGAGDAEIVGRARQAAAPASRKREQRTAERLEKESRESAARERREAEKAARKDAYDRTTLQAVLAAVAAEPGVSGARLEIALRARGVVGRSMNLRAAIEAARLAGVLDTSPGKGGAVSHWLRGEGSSVSPPSHENPPTPPSASEADGDEVGTSSALSNGDGDEADGDEVDEVARNDDEAAE